MGRAVIMVSSFENSDFGKNLVIDMFLFAGVVLYFLTKQSSSSSILNLYTLTTNPFGS